VSPQLPRVSAGETAAALEHIGFVLTRQSGSHRIYKNTAGKRVTIPYHSGKILHPKVLKSILVDAGLTIEEFTKLLKG
jgi:predicted RNA binding protein YcfA (HicA-like mRNA interferase family)